jgi:lysozyme
MKASEKGLNLIKEFEAFRSKAYLCPAGVPTIGYGSTLWPDGKKVRLGETITLDGALKLLSIEATFKGAEILKYLHPTQINQNQFDALVSFVFNVGVKNFQISNLAQKVKKNPNNPLIRNEFMRWNKHRDPKTRQRIVSRGLTRRRGREADLYFS